VIEIRTETRKNRWGALSDIHFLTVDGEVISEQNNEETPEKFQIADNDRFELLLQRRFGELPETIREIAHSLWRPLGVVNAGAAIFRRGHGKYEIEIDVIPVMFEWIYPFSPKVYLEEFRAIVRKDFPSIRIHEDKDPHGWMQVRLRFEISDSRGKIGEGLKDAADKVGEIQARASETCLEQSKGNILATYFSFPEEIKTACEQYLLYFGEVLREIGVKAAVEIKEESDHILFSVRPSDKHQAIDRIRKALELYLNLPAATLTGINEGEYRIEIQRLSANIMHLKSQLLLAEAILEAKNTTIDAQGERLIYQGQLLEGRLLPDLTREQEPEKEELFNNTVAITRYKGKGFELNLPKIYRYLSSLFKASGAEDCDETEEP